jgi:cation:H+ antiporter
VHEVYNLPPLRGRTTKTMETLGSAVVVFLISAAFTIAAGIGLARFGDDLADATGWGKLWVGTLLVGIGTSLPEVTVNISAVLFEDSPGLALGNVFGADMINIFVLGAVALAFGVANVCGGQGRDTKLLILWGIGIVALAALVGATGDFNLGPTSVGGLLVAAAYVAGMYVVYKAGRSDAAEEDAPEPKGSVARAWTGFGISIVVVIIAARYLAASADRLAELSGISASFIGVLLVSIVTTLPEGSVTVTAALRKSYGIVMGNVYGSCFFNVFIIFIADLFYGKGPLLGEMQPAHFAAAIAAFALMSMGYAVVRSCETRAWAWARMLTPAIPIVYIGALYAVFTLGQR